MPILFQHRRLTSLIVSLAILLNLFAPALSQAVTPVAGDPLALDICSVTPATLTPASGKRAPAGLPLHSLKHCMLCATHTGGDAAPAPGASLLVVLEGHDVYPATAATVPAPRGHWPGVQPRGPPAGA